jgi:hypothetical protein
MQAQVLKSKTLGPVRVTLVQTGRGRYMVYHYHWDGWFWLQQNRCEPKSREGYLCRIAAQHRYEQVYVDAGLGRT